MSQKHFLLHADSTPFDNLISSLSQQPPLTQAYSYPRFLHHQSPNEYGHTATLRSLYESCGRTKVLPQPQHPTELAPTEKLKSIYAAATQFRTQDSSSFYHPPRQSLSRFCPEKSVEQSASRPHVINLYENLVEKQRHFTKACGNLSTHGNGGIFQTDPIKPVKFSQELIRKCHVRGVLEVFLDFDLIENFSPKDKIPELLDLNITMKKPKKKMKSFVKGDRSRSETGYFGIRLSTSGYRFRATVNYMGKSYNAGTYLTVEEAAFRYDEKLLELSQGKMSSCRLNCPQLWTPEKKNLMKQSFAGGEKHLMHSMSSLHSATRTRKRTFDEMNERAAVVEPLKIRKYDGNIYS